MLITILTLYIFNGQRNSFKLDHLGTIGVRLPTFHNAEHTGDPTRLLFEGTTTTQRPTVVKLMIGVEHITLGENRTLKLYIEKPWGASFQTN